MPRIFGSSQLGTILGRGFLVVAVLGALGVWSIGRRTPSGWPDRAEHPERIRVVTYNIRAALGGLDEVTRDLQALAPDLVALQEVERDIERSRSRDQAGHLAKALGLESSFAGSFKVDAGEHGIAVLSRFPILEAEILPLPQGGGRWPRVALKVLVDAPGGPLQFVGIHFARPWGWPLSNTETRLQQIDSLLASLDLNEDAPTIVAGDFNSLPISVEGWKVGRKLQGAWKPWRDGWATSFPLQAIGWPAGAVKIDHVFHDEHWRSHGTWVAPQGASDHRPVLADLSLKDPRQ